MKQEEKIRGVSSRLGGLFHKRDEVTAQDVLTGLTDEEQIMVANDLALHGEMGIWWWVLPIIEELREDGFDEEERQSLLKGLANGAFEMEIVKLRQEKCLTGIQLYLATMLTQGGSRADELTQILLG